MLNYQRVYTMMFMNIAWLTIYGYTMMFRMFMISGFLMLTMKTINMMHGNKALKLMVDECLWSDITSDDSL